MELFMLSRRRLGSGSPGEKDMGEWRQWQGWMLDFIPKMVGGFVDRAWTPRAIVHSPVGIWLIAHVLWISDMAWIS
jgi:hypothetical protein